MRITTIFEAMATPSPSPSPVSSPRVLEKGETVDGDQAEGSVKRVGLLFEGLPPGEPFHQLEICVNSILT